MKDKTEKLFSEAKENYFQGSFEEALKLVQKRTTEKIDRKNLHYFALEALLIFQLNRFDIAANKIEVILPWLELAQPEKTPSSELKFIVTESRIKEKERYSDEVLRVGTYYLFLSFLGRCRIELGELDSAIELLLECISYETNNVKGHVDVKFEVHKHLTFYFLSIAFLKKITVLGESKDSEKEQNSLMASALACLDGAIAWAHIWKAGFINPVIGDNYTRHEEWFRAELYFYHRGLLLKSKEPSLAYLDFARSWALIDERNDGYLSFFPQSKELIEAEIEDLKNNKSVKDFLKSSELTDLDYSEILNSNRLKLQDVSRATESLFDAFEISREARVPCIVGDEEEE